MADNSRIEWTDATWNPVTGCTKVSPGCDHCYAERVTERFHGKGTFATVRLHEDRLGLPLRWRRPRRVFVNSMSDLFHDAVPDEFIARVFGVMAATPHHTYQLLTKRHARMRALLSSERFKVWTWAAQAARAGTCTPNDAWPLPNVWLGVSTENQQWADIRIPALLDTPAAIRWISAEPLLGPIDLNGKVVDGHRPRLTYWLTGRPAWGTPEPIEGSEQLGQPLTKGPRLDWVVVGGESGPNARAMHPDWARQLRDQCEAAGIPFFFKQWGEYVPVTVVDDPAFASGRAINNPNGGRTALIIREHGPSGTYRGARTRPMQPGDETRGGIAMFDHNTVVVRVGKKQAGDLLDGQHHHAYPT